MPRRHSHHPPGDYVDRGGDGVAVLFLAFALRLVLLRGNHERPLPHSRGKPIAASPPVPNTTNYAFADELRLKYGYQLSPADAAAHTYPEVFNYFDAGWGVASAGALKALAADPARRGTLAGALAAFYGACPWRVGAPAA